MTKSHPGRASRRPHHRRRLRNRCGCRARLRQPARGGRVEDDLRRPRHDRRAHHHHAVVRRHPALRRHQRRRLPVAGPDRHRRARRRRAPQRLHLGRRLVQPRSATSPSRTSPARPPTRPSSGACVVNFQFSQTGGCTTKVNNGDEVLWVFDAFSKTHVLKLTGPATATTGAPFGVRVIDGQDGSAAAGATVGGEDHRRRRPGDALVRQRRHLQAQGRALRLGPLERRQPLRRPRPAPTRAARATRTPPTVAASLPGRRLASEQGHSRTVLISWQASDADGAGVAYYSVDVRELSDGVEGSAKAGDWKRWSRTHTSSPASTSAATRAAPTSSASPRSIAPATGRRSRPTRWCSRSTIATAASGSCRRLEAQPPSSAWGGTVVRADEAGATGRLRFRGRSVSLIGRKLGQGRPPAGDARRQVAHAAPARPLGAARPCCGRARGCKAGSHTLRMRTLGGGPVELDAVAPRP